MKVSFIKTLDSLKKDIDSLEKEAGDWAKEDEREKLFGVFTNPPAPYYKEYALKLLEEKRNELKSLLSTNSEEQMVLKRETLKSRKHTEHYHDLTSEHIEALLWLVSEFSAKGYEDSSDARIQAAKQALLNFKHNPLDLKEVQEMISSCE